MTPLEDARRLAATEPTLHGVHCVVCDTPLHRPDCPWLAMPRIVAALEAAERMIAVDPMRPRLAQDGQEVGVCVFCEGELKHADDCQRQALAAALRQRRTR